MELQVSAGGIDLPMGQYTARFDNITDHVRKEGDKDHGYGPSVDVHFTVLSGEYTGRQVSQIWTKKFSEQINLGKFARRTFWSRSGD